MQIVENETWALGPYTVHQRPRFDSPAWAVYLVFRGENLIGKHFSRPGLSDCEWLERTNGQVYATRSCWPETSEGHPIWNATATTVRRRGRPRKDVSEREMREALVS